MKALEEVPNVNPYRFLITKLREGDYAHAGDKEAIDMVFKRVIELKPDLQGSKILDVGSGFGGTAQEFYDRGCQNIEGIDIDQTAVAYATSKFSKIPFSVHNALETHTKYPKDHFEFVYLFHVMYSIPDKRGLLTSLRKVIKPGGLLMLYDYACGKEGTLDVTDLANKTMYPINLATIESDLTDTGWVLIENTDLTPNYVIWYERLLSKLQQHKETLKTDFSEAVIQKVKITFTYFLEQINQDNLKGVLLFAQAKE